MTENFTGKGQGVYNTIAGSVGALGGLPALFGGAGAYNNGGACNNNAGVCSENTYVTRFELEQSQIIARLQTEVSLRDANTFTMQEMGKLRDYQEGINTRQAVWNQANTSAISCMNDQIAVFTNMTKTGIKSSAICDDCGTCCGCNV